jgi:hypothetical protein
MTYITFANVQTARQGSAASGADLTFAIRPAANS